MFVVVVVVELPKTSLFPNANHLLSVNPFRKLKLLNMEISSKMQAVLSSFSGDSVPKRQKQLTFAGFSQDASLIAVASPQGYRLYQTDPFKKVFESASSGVGLIEMLFNTSLLALVGSGEQPSFSPRKVVVYNTLQDKEIFEVNCASTILAVKLNKTRLVAVLETKIYIFDLSSMKILATLDTPKNPLGVCALSPDETRNYLIYPGSESKGELLLYDAHALQLITVIQAHQNSVRLVSFNRDASMLATASHKGTVIRIFSVPDGRKLSTFRRGTFPSNIYSLAFNERSTLIGVSGDSNTIHIFDLVSTPDKNTPVSVATSTISQYLPNVLQDVVEPSRSFAFIALKDPTPPTYCTFKGDNLYVLSSAGYFYRYSVQRNGGECKLEGEFSLLNNPSEAISVKFHTDDSKSSSMILSASSSQTIASSSSIPDRIAEKKAPAKGALT